MANKPVFTGSISNNGDIDFQSEKYEGAFWYKEQKNGTPALSGNFKGIGERVYVSLNKFAGKDALMELANGIKRFADSLDDSEPNW